MESVVTYAWAVSKLSKHHEEENWAQIRKICVFLQAEKKTMSLTIQCNQRVHINIQDYDISKNRWITYPYSISHNKYYLANPSDLLQWLSKTTAL